MEKSICQTANCKIYHDNKFWFMSIKERIPFCNGKCPYGWIRNESGWVNNETNKKAYEQVEAERKRLGGDSNVKDISISKVDKIQKATQETNDMDGLIVEYLKTKSIAILQMEIESKVNSGPEDVSKAIRRLKKDGLITSVKKGSFNYYKIS